MPENYYDWLNYISGLDINGYKNFYYGPQFSDFTKSARQFSSANQIKRLSGLQGSQLKVTANNNLAPMNLSEQGPTFLQKLKLAGSNINMDQVSGIASGVTGLAGIVGDSINTGKGEFTTEDLENFNEGRYKDLSAFNRTAGNANTTSDLIQLANYQPDFGTAAGNIETSKYNAGKTLGAMGKGALAGASIGSVVPVIGTAIGAIAGGLFGGITDSIGQGFGISGDKRRKSQAETEAERLGDMAYNSTLHAGTRVSTNTYRKGMANFLNNAAMGGPLSTHGADFTDDIIRIDTGGSHERNPFGGVPAGVDPQGIPNLVEEGETIWDDYVFSRRLKAPKDLVKKFGLGGGKNGMSYAEASKRISEKSGAELRPNDPISKRTKDAQLAELEESQEEKRMKLEQKKIINALKSMSPEEVQGLLTQPASPEMGMESQLPPQGMVEEPMMQEPMQGEGMYEPVGLAFGGPLVSPYNLSLIYDKFNSNTANLFYDGGLFLRINNGLKDGTVVYDPVNKTYTFMNENGTKGSSYTQREYDIIKSTYDKNQARLARRDARRDARKNPKEVTPSVKENVKPTDVYYDTRVEPNLRGLQTFGKRGFVAPENPWYNYLIPEGEPEQTSTTSKTTTGQSTKKTSATTKGNTKGLAKVTIPNEPLALNTDAGIAGILAASDAETRKAVEEALTPEVSKAAIAQEANDKLLPTWMRYAPIVGSGLSVLGNIFSPLDYSDYDRLMAEAESLGKPVTIPVETIGAKLRRNPFDERLAVNQANQNLLASMRGTTDNAGGNRAMRQFANNLLAYNNQGALSDIATKAYLANRQDALQTADFNRATDLYNMNAINQRNLTQAQLNSNREQARFNALMGARQLYDNARRWDDQFIDADLTGLFEGLGNLGRENFIFNQVNARNREGLSPVRYDEKTGNWIFDNQAAACGGKIKTKKRRF